MIVINSIIIVGLIYIYYLYLKKYLTNSLLVKTYIEFKKVFKLVNENKTIFYKRFNDIVYIEYGIEKYIVIRLKDKYIDSEVRLTDDKTSDTFYSSDLKFFRINKKLLKLISLKHKNIFDIKSFNNNIVDIKTYESLEFITELSNSIIKEEIDSYFDSLTKKLDESEENLNIDDILDRINSIGYDKLSEKEKDFLNKNSK